MLFKRLGKAIRNVILLCIAALFVFYVIMPKVLPRDYSEYVEKYASAFGVEQSLVYAVIFCESRFDAQAVSSAGAVGLMQITPDTAKWAAGKISWMEDTDPDMTDPENNIAVGCWYLDWLSDQFANETKTVLAAYNAGHGKVASWLEEQEHSQDGVRLENIPYAETDQYVAKVIFVEKLYRILYGL